MRFPLLRIVFPVLLIAALASCNKSQKEKLCREWNVYKVDFENIKKDSTGQDELQSGIEDIFKQVMSDKLVNTHYTFAEDGSYRVTYNERVVTGEWKLENQGNTLILHNTGEAEKKEQPKPCLIEQLDDSLMVLHPQADQSTYEVRLLMRAVQTP